MNREKAEKLLAALIFDDLDEASKAEALAYLQQDDELRERLADMRMAFKVASDAVQNGPAPVLGQQRRKRLARLAKQGQGGSRIVVLRRLGAVAAVLIVGVSAGLLGILPRLSKVRNLSLPSQLEKTSRLGDMAETSAHYGYAEPRSAKKPDSFGIAPTKEFIAKRPEDDKIALSDSESQLGLLYYKANSTNQPFQDENMALGRGRHSRSAGPQPTAQPATPLSSIHAGEVAGLDSPAQVTRAPKAQKAAPVAMDSKENQFMNTHQWGMQPSSDEVTVEALRQKLDSALSAKKTPGLSRLPELSLFDTPSGDMPTERRQGLDSDREYAYRSLAHGAEDSPSSGVTAPALPQRETNERDSASGFYWSDAGAQSDKQRGLGLDESAPIERRPEKLETRIYDVSDLVRDGERAGEAGVASNERAKTKAQPDHNAEISSFGWSSYGGMGARHGRYARRRGHG